MDVWKLTTMALFAAITASASEARAAEGNVTAVVSEGTLVLTGDDLNNSIVAYQVLGDAQDSMRITGDFTTINGVASAHVSGITAGVRVNLGGGDDEVIFQDAPIAGDINLVDGAGSDYLRLRTVSLSGDLIVRLGSVSDRVDVGDNTFLGGAIDVAGVAPTYVTVSAVLAESVKVVAPEGGVHILDGSQVGKVSLDMPAVGEHSIEISNRSYVAGGVKVKTGDGETYVVVKDTTGIAGMLDVASGSGDDVVQLLNTVVVGAVRARLGGGYNTVQLLTDGDVAGNLTVTNGIGLDVVQLIGSAVGGNLKASLGDGNTVVELLNGSELAGKLDLKTGDGFDTFTVNASRARGDAKAKLGAGGSAVTLDNAGVIDGTLDVKMGSGDDAVTIKGGASIAGDARVTLGDGRNVVELLNVPGAVLGDLRVKGRDGDDDVNTLQAYVGGDTTLKLAGGENAVYFESTTLVGKLGVTGGTGGDVVAGGFALFNGDAKLLLGSGSNDIVIGASTFAGALTIKTGGGNDAIDLTGTTVMGKRTVDTDGGMDFVVLP